LALPVAFYASNANDFACMNGKTDPVDLGTLALIANGHIAQLECCTVWFGFAFLDLQHDFAPNHHVGNLRWGDAWGWHGANHFAVSHHRNSVRDFNHFAQFVRNKNHRVASFGVLTQKLKQLFGLQRRENRSWFIQHQNAAFAVEHF
jgi:hypothetical protein